MQAKKFLQLMYSKRMEKKLTPVCIYTINGLETV